MICSLLLSWKHIRLTLFRPTIGKERRLASSFFFWRSADFLHESLHLFGHLINFPSSPDFRPLWALLKSREVITRTHTIALLHACSSKTCVLICLFHTSGVGKVALTAPRSRLVCPFLWSSFSIFRHLGAFRIVSCMDFFLLGCLVGALRNALLTLWCCLHRVGDIVDDGWCGKIALFLLFSACSWAPVAVNWWRCTRRSIIVCWSRLALLIFAFLKRASRKPYLSHLIRRRRRRWSPGISRPGND